MLGEQIYEARGKINSNRVLDTYGPKMESSYTMQGKVKGVDIVETGTFWSVMRQGGAMYGEDQSVIMTPDGDMCTGRACGVGRFTGPGRISYRGTMICGDNATGKLSSLANMVMVFEVEVDESENMVAKAWEWK